MKKKFKLFATIGSLALAICMMTIGVLAATQVTFNVNSNVTFTADKVYVNVSGKVEYGLNATKSTKQFSGSNYTGEAGSAVATNLELTGDGVDSSNKTLVNWGEIAFSEEINNTIVYTFEITNAGQGDCYVKITAPSYESKVTHANVTIATSCKVGADDYAQDGTQLLESGDKVTYTYTLKLTNVSQSIPAGTFADVDFSFAMQNVSFGA